MSVRTHGHRLVHTRVCMCACVHVCMCACVHVCMCACVHVCMCACVHACMRACVHACMRAYMHVCMHSCVWARECAGGQVGGQVGGRTCWAVDAHGREENQSVDKPPMLLGHHRPMLAIPCHRAGCALGTSFGRAWYTLGVILRGGRLVHGNGRRVASAQEPFPARSNLDSVGDRLRGRRIALERTLRAHERAPPRACLEAAQKVKTEVGLIELTECALHQPHKPRAAYIPPHKENTFEQAPQNPHQRRRSSQNTHQQRRKGIN